MKKLIPILLVLASPGNAGWFRDSEDSRKYQMPQTRQVEVEQSFNQAEFQRVFGGMERSRALKAAYDKKVRESPDFVLFAPVKEQSVKLTDVKPVSQVNIITFDKPIMKTYQETPIINDIQKPQDLKQTPAQRAWVQDAAKAIVSAIKAIIVEVRNAVNFAAGQVFSVLSGDAFRKQEPFKFDPTPGKPALIGVTGMMTKRGDMENMRSTMQKAFGVSDVVMIRNNTGPLRLLSDALQSLGYEILGSYDKPVRSMQAAIREGIKQKGQALVCGHSQGGAVIALALRGLTKEERSKVHIWNGGSEWAIDAKKYGLGSVRNVRNTGDRIPGLANRWNITNYFNPTHMDRINADWNKITVKGIGNEHTFSIYYADDMNFWAQEMLKGEPK